MLFPHPTPDVTKRLEENFELLRRWLERPRDRTVPATTDKATDHVRDAVTTLRQLGELLPPDPWAVRLVADTNVLLDDLDVAIYTPLLRKRYMVHLMPAVRQEQRKLQGITPTADAHINCELLRDDDPAFARITHLRSYLGAYTGAFRTGDTVHVAGKPARAPCDRSEKSVATTARAALNVRRLLGAAVSRVDAVPRGWV
nr:hypothetical protein OG781_02170 [Streptomyces sp. NBC_00830]